MCILYVHMQTMFMAVSFVIEKNLTCKTTSEKSVNGWHNICMDKSLKDKTVVKSWRNPRLPHISNSGQSCMSYKRVLGKGRTLLMRFSLSVWRSNSIVLYCNDGTRNYVLKSNAVWQHDALADTFLKLSGQGTHTIHTHEHKHTHKDTAKGPLSYGSLPWHSLFRLPWACLPTEWILWKEGSLTRGCSPHSPTMSLGSLKLLLTWNCAVGKK